MGELPDWYKPKLPEQPKKDEKKEAGMTRREFLSKFVKGAALVGATGFAANEARKEITKWLSDEEKKEYDNTKGRKEEPEKNISSELDEDEWEYVPGEDREAAQHILGKFNLKKINLGLETKENTKSYWYKKYQENPKLNKSLIDAYNAMKLWKEKLEEIFVKEGVPAEYIYLAIPESHWNSEAKSPSGALGVYQLMPETARMFGLKVSDGVDERKNILKSAQAAARLLKDLHNRTGSWDLALSGYNGGQIWGYLKACGGKENCTYLGFLEYMTGEINNLKTELTRPIWKHTVSEKEKSLGQIAKKYDVSVSAIMKINKISLDKKKNPIIKLDDEINIPIGDMTTKEYIYKRKISGFIENLNYPGKYHAVMEHIRKIEKNKLESGLLVKK